MPRTNETSGHSRRVALPPRHNPSVRPVDPPPASNRLLDIAIERGHGIVSQGTLVVDRLRNLNDRHVPSDKTDMNGEGVGATTEAVGTTAEEVSRFQDRMQLIFEAAHRELDRLERL